MWKNKMLSPMVKTIRSINASNNIVRIFGCTGGHPCNGRSLCRRLRRAWGSSVWESDSIITVLRPSDTSFRRFSSSQSNKNDNGPYATLKVVGTDRNGIVAAFSDLLNRYDCCIVQSEHYTDRKDNLFFQRIVFDHPYRTTTKSSCSAIPVTSLVMTDTITNTNDMNTQKMEFQKSITDQMKIIQSDFNLQTCQMDWYDTVKRMAIYVSQYDHCLWELLLRYRSNELLSKKYGCSVTIPLIISNHQTCSHIAQMFHIPYYVIPKNNDNKRKQEQTELQLLQQYNIDLVCLARYMQILSPEFLNTYPSEQIINIHHSFLPAFQGSRPYHQAYERGVKIIGATAHYVTSELDHGPIIEQDTIHISHRDTPYDFIQKGKMVERMVLVRAIQAHLQNRTFISPSSNKCIVFND